MDCVQNSVKLIFGHGRWGCPQPDVFGHVIPTGGEHWAASTQLAQLVQRWDGEHVEQHDEQHAF